MNFKHLYYFWVAAKAGGVMRAGEQLHTTPQTLSGQIKLLEQWLGRPLFRKSGRQLELTSDGQVALGYADEIFALGAQLEGALRQPRGGQRMLEFRVGVADSVAKSVAYRLLEPELVQATAQVFTRSGGVPLRSSMSSRARPCCSVRASAALRTVCSRWSGTQGLRMYW